MEQLMRNKAKNFSWTDEAQVLINQAKMPVFLDRKNRLKKIKL